jgi:hypothetical protein
LIALLELGTELDTALNPLVRPLRMWREVTKKMWREVTKRTDNGALAFYRFKGCLTDCEVVGGRAYHSLGGPASGGIPPSRIMVAGSKTTWLSQVIFTSMVNIV